MNFSFVDPWHSFLPREGGHVVALSGSGGKTALQRTLGEFYRAEGVPVVLTCTTRIICNALPREKNATALNNPASSMSPSCVGVVANSPLPPRRTKLAEPLSTTPVVAITTSVETTGNVRVTARRITTPATA